MVTRAELIGKLPRPTYRKVKITSNQSALNIIHEILTAQKLYADQYALIAEYFKAPTARETARNVWDFLKTQITYKIEADSNQTSKSPAVFLSDGSGDCKHYSLFTVGILSALGYTCKFRFTSYKAFDKTPQHVYTLLRLESGRYIPVDAVIEGFGIEKPYTFKEDYNIDMSLYRISGPADISGIGRSAKSQAKKDARAKKKTEKKTVRKARRAKRKAEGRGFFRKIGKGIAKIALTPVRAAYTSLIGLNLKGMAKRLNEAIAKDPEKVKNMWTVKFKGNWKSLLKSVARGSKKGKKFTPAQVAGIGAVMGATIGAAQVAAILAAAAPVIIAMQEIIKSILGKGDTDEGADLAAEAATALQNNPTPSTDEINKAVAANERYSQAIDNQMNTAGTSGGSGTDDDGPDPDAGADDSKTSPKGESSSMVVPIALGLGAVLLLSRD